jgi:hypothetical protein
MAIFNKKKLKNHKVHNFNISNADHQLLLNKVFKSCLNNSVELKTLNDWKKNQMLIKPKYDKGAGPKGLAVRQLKWYVSWVQNVVRQFGPYLPWV